MDSIVEVYLASAHGSGAGSSHVGTTFCWKLCCLPRSCQLSRTMHLCALAHGMSQAVGMRAFQELRPRSASYVLSCADLRSDLALSLCLLYRLANGRLMLVHGFCR